jgi:hypothetical protein
MRLKFEDCDLNLIHEISADDDLKDESAARTRRIERRTKIAETEY